MNENHVSMPIPIHELSQEEQGLFMQKTWELLKNQVSRYNGADSTSMPIEKVQHLLESILFTIHIAFEESDNDITESDLNRDFLNSDFSGQLSRGREILEEKRRSAHALWNKICPEAPVIRNYYYVDTLKNIGSFFDGYDIWYAAHEIPCSIDYPLMTPVDEQFKGIEFIAEYLHAISLENRFINCFADTAVLELLRSSVPGYRDHYYNICEIIFVHALGKQLLHKPLPLNTQEENKEKSVSLLFSEEELLSLEKRFAEKNRGQITEYLLNAAEALCCRIDADRECAGYFEREIHSMALRIEEASTSGNTRCVFESVIGAKHYDNPARNSS